MSQSISVYNSRLFTIYTLPLAIYKPYNPSLLLTPNQNKTFVSFSNLKTRIKMAMKATLIAAILFAVAVTMMTPQVEGITCGQVASSLAPCINYLKTGGTPPPACCTGVGKLKSSAVTTQDKQTACGCIKSSASSIKGINYSYASALPGKCRVSIPYQISPNTDCNAIH